MIDLFNLHTDLQGVAQVKNTLGIGCGKLFLDLIASGENPVYFLAPFAVGPEPVTTDFKAAQAFLQGLFKSAADGHGLAHGFHGRGQ